MNLYAGMLGVRFSMTAGDGATSTEREMEGTNDEGHSKEQHDDEANDNGT